jgi:hypothetical protein
MSKVESYDPEGGIPAPLGLERDDADRLLTPSGNRAIHDDPAELIECDPGGHVVGQAADDEVPVRPTLNAKSAVVVSVALEPDDPEIRPEFLA